MAIVANIKLALPHDDVDTSEFYKHIENGLPEPRRMRQLLTWCGTRALGEKPQSTSKDYHAVFAGTFDVPKHVENLEITLNSTRDTATAVERLFY